MSCLWLVGALAAGAAVGAAAATLAARRVWRNARRIAARSKGRENLLELGQLAGGLAHEIKNPLSTISVNLKLLIEDIAQQPGEPHDRWLRRLRSVQDEASRVRDILEDFLRLTGRYELHRERVDLRRVLEELTDFFGPQAEAAGVVLRTGVPGEPVVCEVDVKLVKQGVLNLLINGVEAMEAGGELLLRLGRQRDSAVVEVIDTGSGMVPETLDRIFDVYYSTKTGGSGLGLPTTRRIVQENGGSLHVESEPGKGTRFVVKLPLAEDDRR